MVLPATVVAATRSASDTNLRCRREEWFRLQNGLATASILDFRARLGNRCRVFPGSALKCAVILDFRARLANRCKVLPVYALQRAVILDFSKRLRDYVSAL